MVDIPESINKLLSRYTHITPPDESVRKMFVAVTQKYTSALTIDHITIRRGIVYVSTTPAIKHMLFIHKEALIQELYDRLGDDAPKDIR